MGLRLMFHAKRIVGGVGGKTGAVALQNVGKTHYFGLDTTQKVEKLVINFEQFPTKFLYTTVSNISGSVPEQEENIKSNLAVLPEMLRQYRDEYRKIMTPSAIEGVTPTSE